MDWFLYDNGHRHKRVKEEICPCRLCKTYIYHMLILFKVLSLYLFFETHSGAVHQKLSYEESFLRGNALTWFSSSAFTACFLSDFSNRIFYLFF